MNEKEIPGGEPGTELDALRERFTRLETHNRRVEKNLKECQQQLQQAQKMETLGTLVAGVAHDMKLTTPSISSCTTCH
jgi:C4-dicarboxylate-specific signal transduction histidine kinase